MNRWTLVPALAALWTYCWFMQGVDDQMNKQIANTDYLTQLAIVYEQQRQ